MSSRSERLLALMQALRARRRPVSAKILAQETGVSIRSVYRDIASLRSMGAIIDGEAGIGYMASADYFLPPLRFSTEEIEALVLGLRGLSYGPDKELGQAARRAQAKILDALGPESRREMDAVALFAFPDRKGGDSLLAVIRKALREERVLEISYEDRNGEATKRDIWPLALGFRDDGQILLAHCTLRNDFRQFHVARITQLSLSEHLIGQSRQMLLSRWVAQTGVPDLR